MDSTVTKNCFIAALNIPEMFCVSPMINIHSYVYLKLTNNSMSIISTISGTSIRSDMNADFVNSE
jgi:hypothetical protein